MAARKTGQRLRTGLTLLAPVLGLAAPVALAAPPRGDDPHYTEAGFFDLHVCNWPERSRFFLAVFTSVRYPDIANVTVVDPRGANLATFDLERYRTVEGKAGKPDKRIYFQELEIPENAVDGWYQARIALRDGRQIRARDYVYLKQMPRAQNLRVTTRPLSLRWDPVAGARYYRVTIRDSWENNRVIYTSKLLDQPRLQVPQGLLQPDGVYTWRVNARDSNEDPRLGDFNHGSLSVEADLYLRSGNAE